MRGVGWGSGRITGQPEVTPSALGRRWRIASGIMAHLIAEDSKHISEIDDMLTLDGLRILFERNRAVRPRGRPH